MSGVIKVADHGLVATLHLPGGAGRHPAIIVLSGSEGGVASANIYGAPLASSGFAALCLAYFAMEGLPDDLSLIPIEYVRLAVDWLRAHPAIDRARIGVLGSSRGGEAAVLVGAFVPEVRAVVANVPSHVVWQGMAEGDRVSSWSVAGAGLPFVPLVPYRAGMSWRAWFEASLADPSAPADAAIPVERTNGAMLFISGTDDGVWPSGMMADAAMERLTQRGFPFHAEHARYEGAGHAVLMPPYRVGPIENPWPAGSYRRPRWMTAGLPPVTLGGSPEGNRLARLDAWPRMLRFFRQHLGS